MAVKVYIDGDVVIVDNGTAQVNTIRLDSFFFDQNVDTETVYIRDTDDDYNLKVLASDMQDQSGTPIGTFADVVTYLKGFITAGTATPLPAGAATESTLLAIYNNMVASQDVEILLVRDIGAVPVEIVQQIREYDQGTGVWTTRYEDVNGAAYVPVGPLEYLDASAVLNLLLAEALDQGLTLDAIQAEQLAQGLSLDSLVTNTTGLATQTTLNDLLTAFNSEDFAQEVTSQLINSNIVLGNLTLNGIKSQTDLLNFIATALEVNVTSSVIPTGAATEATQVLNNTALGSILAQLDVDLSTRASQATQELINTTLGFILAQLDVDLSTRASEATLELVRLLLVDLKTNTADNATETTLALINAALAGTLSVNFTNSSIEVTQGTHNNLNANANIQVGDVDVSGANPVPVTLPTGVAQGMYRSKLVGLTAHIITAGATSMAFINNSDVAATFTDAGSNVTTIEPGEEFAFEASGSNTLGSVTVNTPVGSEIVWVAVY